MKRIKPGINICAFGSATALTAPGESDVLLVRKLALLLNEQLPGRRIFFVYTHKNGYDRFHHGLKANTEISYFCFCALRRHFPRVTFLRFQNEHPKRIARIRKGDVVIGHIGETFERASKRTDRLISFGPFVGHEDHVESRGSHCSVKEEEMGHYHRAKVSILLTSEYNEEHYLKRSRNFWYPFFQKERYRVVHQPIDLEIFPRIKWDYETGNFFYIGHRGHMKCVEDSIYLANASGRTLHLFGTEDRRFDNLNKEQVQELPKIADFFIQPGMWEGQSVAILEAQARGFIPIVSKETGYPYDHPYLLKYGDRAYNLKVLQKLLLTTPQERRELADHLYEQLKQDPHHNSWNQLTNVLVDEVKKLIDCSL